MNFIKNILGGRAVLGASTHRIIRNTFTLQPHRGLTTQGTELVLSSPTSKYQCFFPSYCREDEFNRIDFFASRSSICPPKKLPAKCLHFEDKPHYTSHAFGDFNNIEPVVIEKGQHFDVISLLSTHVDHLIRIGSNNPVKASDLRGKYILLVCAFVPSIWKDGHGFRDISLLTSEMCGTHVGRNLFEVVIVPKMRQKWDNDEGAFRHFISAFPNCLVIPFMDKYGCDYICKTLNFDGEAKYIYVDALHKVLQVHYDPIVRYGAHGFPFTDDHLRSLRDEASWDAPKPSIKSLAGLLCCEFNPSSVFVRKFDSEETISVEQLNKHHVGLYFFNRGTLLKDVGYIYKQCRDQGIDLEILLVCLPFSTSLDPEVYQDIVSSILKKYQVSNWWVFPYNNSAYRRLHKLSNNPYSDNMFMVGPHNKFVNVHAGLVLSYFGQHFGPKAYPFSMKALIQALLKRLSEVTLESILTYDYVYRDYECDNSKVIPVSELRGKNVVVYATSCLESSMLGYYCESLVTWYNKIKEKDSDFEVVLVPVLYNVPDSEYQKHISRIRENILKSKTKWLVCPFDDLKQSRCLEKHDAFLFGQDSTPMQKGLLLPAVLAFGKDGHLHSITAINHLDRNGLDAYPFLPEVRNQILYDEIFEELYLMSDMRVALCGWPSDLNEEEEEEDIENK